MFWSLFSISMFTLSTMIFRHLLFFSTYSTYHVFAIFIFLSHHQSIIHFLYLFLSQGIYTCVRVRVFRDIFFIYVRIKRKLWQQSLYLYITFSLYFFSFIFHLYLSWCWLNNESTKIIFLFSNNIVFFYEW